MSRTPFRCQVPWWAALLLAAPLSGWAQVPSSLDPGAVQQRQLDEQRRREQEERQRIPRVQRPLDVQGAPQAQPDEATLALRLRVNEIVFTPSQFLSADALAELAKPLVGREVTLGELLGLVDRINALYRERGIATARALLPAQEVTGGRVQIRLVEATLGRIDIQGNATTNQAFILERIGQQTKQVVDPAALEADLIRFNRLYDAQLRARLEPGREAATTDLLIGVEEPPARSLRLGFDNAGSASSGRERLMLGGTWRSLLGRRDDMALNLSASAGTWGGSVGYTVPVSRLDTRLALLLAYDHNKVTSGAFEVLNLNGHSSTQSLTMRQPLIVGDRDLLEASLAWRQRDSVNRAETVDLQRARLRDLTLGLDGSTYIGPVSASLDAQWSRVDANTTDGTGTDTPRDYSVLRASVHGGWEFQPTWALQVSLSAQLADDQRLPAADQFYLGGDGTVRGYSASVVGGDDGASASIELHHPMPSDWLPQAWHASGFGFWDAGRVKPFRAPGSPLPGHDWVHSLGWGLEAQLGRTLHGRLVLAHALDRPQTETLGRNVLHVQLSWQIE